MVLIHSFLSKEFLHISEHNNTKELALKTVTDKLDEINFNHDNIILTDQYISLEMVEV